MITKYYRMTKQNGTYVLINMTETEKLKTKAYKQSDLSKGMLVYVVDLSNSWDEEEMGTIYEITYMNKDSVLVVNDEGYKRIDFIDNDFYPIVLDDKEPDISDGFDKLQGIEDILDSFGDIF